MFTPYTESLFVAVNMVVVLPLYVVTLIFKIFPTGILHLLLGADNYGTNLYRKKNQPFKHGRNFTFVQQMLMCDLQRSTQ